MIVAVIPARGGSKRLPRKNIRFFNGKPMIAWSIEAAVESNVFDRIIVSTDDEEISCIAKERGAEVPFVRPAKLSDDYTATTAVIAHATQWLLDQGSKVDALCCIYATAPFVQAADIREGLIKLKGADWAYTFSVTDFAAPIFRAFQKVENGGVKMFFSEYFDTRSQDLPEAFHDAGQFYWGLPSSWLENKKIFDFHSAPIVVPRWRVQDIDTQRDWERAEVIAASIFEREVI